MRVVGLVAATSVVILGGVGPSNAATSGTTPAAAAVATIRIASPRDDGSYERSSRIVARFRCSEPGRSSIIVGCEGTVSSGRPINTRTAGAKSFTVTATDTSGTTTMKTVRYTVWDFINPLRRVAHLKASRIDMGVDYSGSGPIGAIGEAKVIFAKANISGPERCWGRTCAPPGSGMVVYQLLDGPFAGKYVYAVENITVTVRAGQTVAPGATIAILHEGSPNLEVGWAAGDGAETLAVARGHQCACVDPGGWSSIEGRNFDGLLTWVGAPSGYITSIPPDQRMPRGWPRLSSHSPHPRGSR